jgi:hypothetical protein
LLQTRYKKIKIPHFGVHSSIESAVKNQLKTKIEIMANKIFHLMLFSSHAAMVCFS